MRCRESCSISFEELAIWHLAADKGLFLSRSYSHHHYKRALLFYLPGQVPTGPYSPVDYDNQEFPPEAAISVDIIKQVIARRIN
jgi:hypothetical protein